MCYKENKTGSWEWTWHSAFLELSSEGSLRRWHINCKFWTCRRKQEWVTCWRHSWMKGPVISEAGEIITRPGSTPRSLDIIIWAPWDDDTVYSNRGEIWSGLTVLCSVTEKSLHKVWIRRFFSNSLLERLNQQTLSLSLKRANNVNYIWCPSIKQKCDSVNIPGHGSEAWLL